MKRIFQKRNSSRIIHKLSRRIFLIGVCGLILSTTLYYQFSWKSLRDSTIKSTASTNAEIANQINTSIENLTDTSQYLLTSTELMNKLFTYYQDPSNSNASDINLLLHSLIVSMGNIRAVCIDGPSDTYFYSLNTLAEEEQQQFETEVYQQVRDNIHKVGYSSIYTTTTDATTYYLMAYFYNFDIGSRNFTMTIFYNATSMVKTVENLTATSFDGCMLNNYLQTTFYQTGETGTGENISQENFTYSSGDYLNGSDGYYFYSSIDTPTWNIVSYMSYRTLFLSFYKQFAISLFLSVLMIVFLIIALNPAIRQIIQPIHELNQTMQQVVQGDLSCYSSIQTNDEIGDLSRVYNQMIDSLNRHIETILEYETKEQRMIYNLLIAQIDTHFIYNTMSIINSFARQGKTQEIISANSALIKIMQNCLRVKTIDVTDTIEQEMDVVNQYWIIENMRYDNEVQLIWEVPEHLYKDNIPKNLIQPIVENSLFHGLVDEETGILIGEIRITIAKEGDSYYCIRIADNGCGFDQNILELLNNPNDSEEMLNERGKHIGIINIRQRLNYIYKNHASMTLFNENGAVVEMRLPVSINGAG